MEKNSSILLGAGFSAPMGYPIRNELNDSLINSINDNFKFASDGTLVVISKDGRKSDFGYRTEHDIVFEFCHKLMLNFKTKINS